MKRLFLPLFFLMSAATAFSQDRPRYVGNFDASGGVQTSGVSSSVPVDEKQDLFRTPAQIARNPYLPSPPTAVQTSGSAPVTTLVKKTVQVTMTVYDGFAHRDLPTPVAGPRTLMVGERSYLMPASMNTVMAVGKSLRGFSTGDDLVDSYIVDSSRRYNIDPLLIYAQMGQESSFKPRAKSHKGASGLMQLMPLTAKRLGVTNIFDPRQNIEGGVKYMRILLNMFNGDVNLALAGYNAGEGAVIKYGYQIPPYNETQDYVRRISSRYRAISGPTTAQSPRTSKL